jgi:dihydrofolate reductase
VRGLKEQEGDIYVSGSGTLVRALLADGLVDELDLFVYPVTRGDGPRLFEPGDEPRKFTVAHAQTYDNGVVHVAYRP